MDHVIPLSRGGRDEVGNIQPLCKPCNSGKRDRTVDYRALLALVNAVVAGRLPIEAIRPNMVVLNGMARALKDSLALPGVKAVPRRDVAVRA